MTAKKNKHIEMVLDGVKDLLDDIEFLTIGLVLIGGVFFFIGILVLHKLYNTKAPEIWYFRLFSLVNLLLIASNLFTILRREAPRPGLPSIKGFWPSFLAL